MAGFGPEMLAIDNMPIVTFGEDEAGEAYLTDAFGQIFGLVEVRPPH